MGVCIPYPATLSRRETDRYGYEVKRAMKAPCGIELKVGQVWERGASFWPLIITLVNDPLVMVVHAQKQPASGEYCPCAASREVDPGMFTGKRGGYKLVKDVE